MVCGQELRLAPERIDQIKSWCQRRGWTCLLAASIKSPHKGPSTGGVGIFVRTYVGLRPVPAMSVVMDDGAKLVEDGILEPARLIAAVIELPEHPPVLVGSGYLHVGEGMSESNYKTLQKIGRAVTKWGGPWALTCD